MTGERQGTDPADLGAIEARRMIGRRALSPVELAEACIARVEALDGAVNALIARDFDGLMRDARAAEAAVMAGVPLGALHGLPVAVKDMIDVKGLPTTFGSEIFRDNIAGRDDPSVVALREAGASPIGKTNTPEWSAGGNTRNRVNGVTANPYDLEKTCAGSSGDRRWPWLAAMRLWRRARIRAGAFAIRRRFAGLSGFGRARGCAGGERSAALIPLPSAGPMARSVADVGLMLSVMARPDRGDPFTVIVEGRTGWDPAGFAALPARDPGGIRIAATEDFGFAPVEGIVRDQFRRAIGLLAPWLSRLGEASPDCADADRVFSVLRSLQFLGRHADYVDTQPELVGPNVTENVAEGRGYSAEDVARALIAQGAYYRRWQGFFEQWDVILAPAVTISPRSWRELYPEEIDGIRTKSYYHWLAMAYASTLAGHPSITIPCGFDARGMPFGLQVIGRRHDDRGLLAVAAELEAVIAGISELAPRGPDLAALGAARPIREAEGFLGFA